MQCSEIHFHSNYISNYNEHNITRTTVKIKKQNQEDNKRATLPRTCILPFSFHKETRCGQGRQDVDPQLIRSLVVHGDRGATLLGRRKNDGRTFLHRVKASGTVVPG